MVSIYNKKGNILLAYFNNDIENIKDYTIIEG